MNIIKERTRLIFSEYTDGEKRYIEDMVASMDNIYLFEDKDKNILGLPTGMEERIRKTFPKATWTDKSDTYWPYNRIEPVQHEAKPRNQLQIDFINFVLENAKKKQKLAGILSTGTGKGQPNSTPIPTPNGWTTIGDLDVGNQIFGSDGKPIYVTDIFEKGIEDIYKVKFNDGRTTYVDIDHLWNVCDEYGNNVETLNTKQIRNGMEERDYYIPLLSSPLEYPHQDVPIDPYVFGAMMCEITKHHSHVIMSTINKFTANTIAELCDFVAVPYDDVYFFYNKHNGLHEVYTDELFADMIDCFDTSGIKEIPDCYIRNDYETRLRFLQGVMDSVGYLSEFSGRVSLIINNISLNAMKQIQELIQGLGYICSIKPNCGYRAEVSIIVSSEFRKKMFTDPKKLAIIKDGEEIKTIKIESITYDHKEEARCIMVSAEDELYVTEQSIVTHNTFMACYSAIAVGMKTLIIAPTSAIKQQWADTLTGMFNVAHDRVLVVKKPEQLVKADADFIVISQSTLSMLNNKYDLEKILKDNRFGIKIVDEVQMFFKSTIFTDASSNIANNWYITGTFGRSSETENRIYQEMFGDLAIFREKDKKPTLFNRKPGNIYGMKPYINCKMIWTHSGLTQEQIKSVTNSMRYSEREGKWMRFGISVPKYVDLIIPPDGRMTKMLRTILNVVAMAEREVKYGKTLVLGNTIQSAEIVASYLRKMYPNKKIHTYHSKHTKQENELAKSEADILVSTTSSAGTGFDWKGLAKLVLYSCNKSWILTDQLVGRLRRRDDGKECFAYDIVDADIKQLRAWGSARADVEKRKCKTFKVIDM